MYNTQVTYVVIVNQLVCQVCPGVVIIVDTIVAEGVIIAQDPACRPNASRQTHCALQQQCKKSRY